MDRAAAVLDAASLAEAHVMWHETFFSVFNPRVQTLPLTRCSPFRIADAVTAQYASRAAAGPHKHRGRTPALLQQASQSCTLHYVHGNCYQIGSTRAAFYCLFCVCSPRLHDGPAKSRSTWSCRFFVSDRAVCASTNGHTCGTQRIIGRSNSGYH